MTRHVLVLGGSGFVGRHFIEQLQRADIYVTVPTRRMVAARELWPLPFVTPLETDVTQAGVLARMVPGHDAVINLIGTLHGNQAAFERLHVELPRQLADACAASGVRRVLHVSALGVSADAPSRYLRTKAAGEDALQQAAKSGALDLTILRPSVMYGADDRFLNVFARLQRTFPVLAVPCANARFQPVWVRDVAEALVRCLGNRDAVGETIEVAGPDIWTLRDLVRSAGKWSGVRGGRGRPVIGLPGALGSLQALFMEWMPGRPLLSRDNLASMKVDSIATGKLPGLGALGIQPASLPAVAPTYLGRDGSIRRLDVYRQYAGR